MLATEARSLSLWLEADDGTPPHPDTVDGCFASVWVMTRHLTTNATGATHVILRRTKPADLDTYRELLGDVRFDADHDRCTFGAEALLAPIEGADPAILSALEPYAERRVAE